MRPQKSWTTAALVVALLPLVLLQMEVPAMGAGTTNGQQMLPDGAGRDRLVLAAPAYWYPGPMWSSAVRQAPAVRYLIANPASGPGDRQDAAYADVVSTATAAGVHVLGYVHTSWGERPLPDVLAEIAAYREWYGITDVFLDEAATSPELLPYYRELAQHVRETPGAIVALNPGTVPDERYASVADVLVVFEGSYSVYRTWSPPDWVSRYPRSRFWHLVYATERGDLGRALRKADRRRAGAVFVTDRRLHNPWDQLPSYWSREVDLLRRLNSA